MRVKKNLKKDRWYEYECLSLLAVLIVVIVLRHISDRILPRIAQDELGYWSVAAFFCGEDWSVITQEYPYYSWGYGALISCFIRWIKTPQVAYQAALVFNAILLVGSFSLTYTIGKKIIKTSQYFLMLLAFFLTVIPNNILYSQMAWAENLMTFGFLVIVWLLMKLQEESKRWHCMVLAVMSCYLYVVHQRSLGLLVIVILAMILLTWRKKITLKQCAIFFGTMVILFLVQKYVKSYLKEALWFSDTNSSFAVNDYSGQMEKVLKLFSKNGLIEFVEALLGRIYYTNIASCFLVSWCICSGFRKCIFALKNRKLDAEDFFQMFIILSFCATLTISAIYMLGPGRIDTLFYGRYTDWLLGPMMLVGFKCFWEEPHKGKTFCGIMVFQLAITVIMNMILLKYNVETYYTTNCTVLNVFYHMTPKEFAPYFVYIATILTCFVSMGFFYFLVKDKDSEIRRYIAVFGISFLSICLGEISIYMTFDEDQGWKELETTVVENVSLIRQLGVHEINVMEPLKMDILPNLGLYRFLLPDISIRNVTEEMIKEEELECVLIDEERYDTMYLQTKYDFLGNTGRLHMAMLKNSKLKEELNIIEAQRETEIDLSVMHYQQLEKGGEGYVIYGPYLTLPRAYYEVTFELENDNESSFSGICEISTDSGENIIQQTMIDDKAFVDGRLMLTIPFSLYEKTHGIEFRILSLNGENVKLRRLFYKEDHTKYVPGLESFVQTKQILEDINVCTEKKLDISKIFVLDESQESIKLSYLENRTPGLEWITAKKMDIERQSDATLVLAERKKSSWMGLLEQYHVIRMYEDYLLLQSRSELENQNMKTGDKAYISLALLQKRIEDTYKYQHYDLHDGGQYAIKLYLDKGIIPENIQVEVYNGDVLIEKMEDHVLDESFCLEFVVQSQSNLSDLSFKLYEQSSGKLLQYKDGKIAQLRDGLTYIYDEVFSPLMLAREKLGSVQEYWILDEVWNPDTTISIEQYFKENGYKAHFLEYIQDDNFDEEYLIVSKKMGIIFDMLKAYEIASYTEQYVLMVKKDIIGELDNNTITWYSQDGWIDNEFFDVSTNDKKYQRIIKLPVGTFEIGMESRIKNEELPVEIRFLDNKKILKTEMLQNNQSTVKISSSKGVGDLRIEILETVPGNAYCQATKIRKISDAYEISMENMLSTTGFFDKSSQTITVSGGMIYGPYVSLEAGTYKITFHYSAVSSEGLSFDIAVDSGTVVCDSDTAKISRDKDELKTTFILETDETLNEVEFRTYTDVGKQCTLKAIEIEPLKSR